MLHNTHSGFLYCLLQSHTLESRRAPAEMKAPFQACCLKGNKQEDISHIHKVFLSKLYIQPKTTIIII